MLTALFLIHSITAVTCIVCYQCNLRPTQGENGIVSRPCTYFDYSNKFIVNCTHSTFCMKKTFTLPLNKIGDITVLARGCAPQLLTYQVYENGQWNMAEKIYEDYYTPGCSNTDYSAGLKSNTEEYCFCKGDLCNSDKSAHQTNLTLITFLLLTIKYS